MRNLLVATLAAAFAAVACSGRTTPSECEAKTCTAQDQCHVAGVCDPSTGNCSNPAKPDDDPCSDGNACTVGDTCQGGACSPGTAKTCTAQDQCHVVGVCDSSTGNCSNPAKPNDDPCTDGNACTVGDTCQSGACSPGTAKTCTAQDQCHVVGVCDSSTGNCSNPARPDDDPCTDGNACTMTDTCQGGFCVGANPVVCDTPNACHMSASGVCDTASGSCQYTAATAGTVCRAAVVGGCDVAETCDGSTGACPADVVTTGGTVCRASVGTCDAAETCNGTSPACPADALVPSGTTCRVDAGQCDVAETCDGVATTCPPDGFAPSGTACTESGGTTCNASGTCVAPPVITLVAPATVAASMTLNVTGTDLGGATLVTVGGLSQTFSGNTATSLQVPSLAAATPLGTQPVVVTTAGGASGAFNVNVLAPFKILSATAINSTQVDVTFNRNVGAVAPARFTIATLTVVSATAAGAVVSLITSSQTPAASYTVSTDAQLLDASGTPASATDTATFSGFELPLPTEFVVARVGDGVTAATSSTAAFPVLLERRSIATGAVTGTVQLPMAPGGGNFAFTEAGSATGDGSLTRSEDGKLLAMLGYSSLPGTPAVQSVTAPRVVAVVDASDFTTPAGVDTRTTIGTVFNNTAPRSALIDGTTIWVAGGTSGLFTTTLGATTQPTNVVTTPANNRVLGAYGGQLYVSTGSITQGLYQVGTNLPTTATTATLVVPTTSPYAFAVFDLDPNEPGIDTIYLVDDSQGIKRFVRTAGVWATTPQAILGPNTIRQLACFKDGNDVVCLGSNSANIWKVRDVNHALPTGNVLTSIGTAAINTVFRGVALAPVP